MPLEQGDTVSETLLPPSLYLALSGWMRYSSGMQSIDESAVKHIAHLSKLVLTDEDVARYTPQLEAILEYASHLPEVSAHAKIETFLRVDEDAAVERHNPHALLRNAVAMEDGNVKVPAILDRSES